MENGKLKVSNYKNNRGYYKIIIIFICCSFANFTFAWNAAGHHLMAAITWDLMDAKQQNYWVNILEHHPRFEQDFKKYIPKYVTSNPNTYKQWVFRQAARWADVPRGLQKKQKQKYHHGSWHYINYPIYLDKKINTNFVNLDPNFHGKLHNDLNIIQALKGNIKILAQHGATKKQKALALSWVLHLVGDAHQPLHSSALFSKKYFPKGDRGGNLTKINGQGRFTNLHWYWDARLNNTTSFRNITLKAKKLNKKYSSLGHKSKQSNIKQWLLAANKISGKYVYTDAILATYKYSERQGKQQPDINISNKYDIQARKTAEKQIVKAAYRMADILIFRQ